MPKFKRTIFENMILAGLHEVNREIRELKRLAGTGSVRREHSEYQRLLSQYSKKAHKLQNILKSASEERRNVRQNNPKMNYRDLEHIVFRLISYGEKI